MWKEMFHASARTGTFSQLLFFAVSQVALLSLVVDFDWQVGFLTVVGSFGFAAFCFVAISFFLAANLEHKIQCQKQYEIALASLGGMGAFTGVCGLVLMIQGSTTWPPLLLCWAIAVSLALQEKYASVTTGKFLLLHILPVALMAEVHLLHREVYVLSTALVLGGGASAYLASYYFDRMRVRHEVVSEPEPLEQV